MSQRQKIRQRKLRAVRPSKQAEVYYRKQLDQLVSYMQSIVVEELQRDTMNDALFSKGVELLASQMDRILNRLEAMDINNFATSLARGFVNRMNRNSSDSFNSNLKNSIGVDMNKIVSPPEISDALNVAIAQNTALIKSIKDEYKEKVSKLIRDNVLSGERPSNIVTQVKDIGGVTKNRAAFIARDQTAKINSDLVQIRSETLGSDTYVWSGSMDERERQSHKVMEGKLCKWSDPTVYSDDDGKTWKKRSAIGGEEVNVGKSYNCRCVAIVSIKW